MKKKRFNLQTEKNTPRVDFKKKKMKKKKNGEKVIRSAEEEEEEGEGRTRFGNGAFEARADEDMDGIGGASQGCVCIACASEIE